MFNLFKFFLKDKIGFVKNKNKIKISYKILKYKLCDTTDLNNVNFGYFFKKNDKYYYYFNINNEISYTFSKNYKLNILKKLNLIIDQSKFEMLLSIKYLLFIKSIIYSSIKINNSVVFFNKVNFLFFYNLKFIIFFFSTIFKCNLIVLNELLINRKIYTKKIPSLKKNRKKIIINKIKKYKLDLINNNNLN